jgi:predicted nucleic acid-binding protein
MAAILFDTSVYVDALRRGDLAIERARGAVAGERLWLSAVVLAELLAGAWGAARKSVERLGRDFEKVERLLVPNGSDWQAAGALLARFGERYGYESIGRSRMMNDVLVASSAARRGVTVVTANARDFARIQTLRPAFSWRAIE